MTDTIEIPLDELEARRRATLEMLALPLGRLDEFDLDAATERHLCDVRAEASVMSTDEQEGD